MCICYYLCLKNPELCHPALYSNAIEYLMSTLQNKTITRSFATTVIEFHKHLLLHLYPQEAASIDVVVIENSLSQFAIRFDQTQIINSLRDAIALMEKRVDNINCETRWMQL